MATESALVFEAAFPVRFTPFLDGQARLSGALENNLKVFQACDLLDERPQTDRMDLDSPVALELKRLDLKMTLMLELMMDLMHQGENGAGHCDAAVDFSGITWSPSPRDLVVGQRGMIELFIHSGLPRPLKFAGAIIAVDPARSSARFEFDRLDDLEADQLERLIFKRHRRKVADVRGLKRPV